MAGLGIDLLGTVRVTRDGQPAGGLAYDKVRALLAYLAVESDRPHRREALAGLLWPDQPHDRARHSLRQALATLRRSIGDLDAQPPALLITRDMVQFNPAADVVVDTIAFDALLASVDACNANESHRLCDRCLERLSYAMHLYRGDFLAGFSLADSLEFDDWTLLKRERLRTRAIAALDLLGEHHERAGAVERARVAALRQIELDSCLESAYRRLMRLYHARGDRAAALAQYERCRSVLADQLGVEPNATTLDLYDRIRRDTGGSRPAPGTRNQIPSETTVFIGREAELAEIDALLGSQDCRLITLTGPGGIGKTRLAIHAARNVERIYAHGIHVVPLAGLESSRMLASTLMEALAPFFSAQVDSEQALLGFLRDREMLLALDNFEQVLDGAGLVETVLEHSPGIQILVTSRQRLNLRGEWALEVRGMALPSDDLVDLSGNDSARLFFESARRANARFVPQPDDLSGIVRICRLVDGMPLALELAAAWTPVLSCSGIADEVERSIDFLSASFQDAPDRHRSMRAVFDHSWNLLSPGDRDAFMRLSVFRGGFLRHAAERVAGTPLLVLSKLTGQSLVRRGGDDRYEIHELLRQYGLAKLQGNPSMYQEIRTQHCAYYTDFLADREPVLRGAGQERALSEISGDIENVRLAWRWMAERADAEAIIRTVHAFWLFSEVTSRYAEVQSVLRMTADCLESALNARGEDDQLTRALAMTLIREGSVYARLGDRPRGERLIDRGIRLLSLYDAPSDMGLALNFKAMYAHGRQQYEQEREYLLQSIDYFRAARNRWGQAYSLNDLGMVTYLLGDSGEARRLHSESLGILSDMGDKRGMAFALHNLGVVAAGVGDPVEARRRLREALAIRRILHHVWAVAETLIQLGRVSRQTGDLDDAMRCLLDALEAATEAQTLPARLNTLVEIVALLRDSGERDQAISLLADIASHPAGDAAFHARTGRLLREFGIERSTVSDSQPIDDGWTAGVDWHSRRLLRARRLTPSTPTA